MNNFFQYLICLVLVLCSTYGLYRMGYVIFNLWLDWYKKWRENDK